MKRIARIIIPALVVFTSCSKPLKFTDINKIDLHYQNSSEIKSSLAESDESWKYQVAAWDASYIGNYQQCLEFWDYNASLHSEITDESMQSFNSTHKPVDAIEYISKQSETHLIVIINCNSHYLI